MCGSVLGHTTASKSSNRRDEPINPASFSLRSMGLSEVPNDLFDRAQSAEEMGDIAEAERLYRLLMKSDSGCKSPRLYQVSDQFASRL